MMTKQQILELTGLTEDQFYDQYPDQESFCQDYPEACAQLQQAQEGINVVEQVSPSLRNQIGVNTQGDVGVVAYTPQVQPMVRDEYGNLRRPKTHDRMGRPIGPMVQTFDKIPVVNKPGGYINPEFEGYASNQPTTGWQTTTGMWNRPGASVNAPYIDRSKTLQPLKVLAPIVNNYNLPKELVKANLQTVPLKDFGSAQTLQKAMTPMQTMYNVGSTGAPSSTSLNKFSSVVDLLKSKGKDSSFAERKKLAETYGIKNYTGSAAQNMQLMDYVSKMKKGGQLEQYQRAGQVNSQFKKPIYYSQEEFDSNPSLRQKVANYKEEMDLYNSGDYIYDIQPYILQREQSLKRLQSVRPPMVASKVDMQGLPIVVEQQTGRPIYGPGRTLIAYSDEEGNVAPVQYSGAPSSEMGLLDKTLLENPEEFRKYIKKLGSNYKFKNDATVRFNMDELRQGGQPCYECGGNYDYQNGGVYVIKKGDILSGIASKNNISLSKLLSINPQFKSNPDLIYPGQKVLFSNAVASETPMQKSNREYASIAEKAISRHNTKRNINKILQYQVKPSDAYSVSSNNYKLSGKIENVQNTPKSLPNKKQSEQRISNDVDLRHLESGMIEDKNKGLMYVVKEGKVVRTMPIMTGLNKNVDYVKTDYDLNYLEKNPKARVTPVGSYLSVPNPNIYGRAGFNMIPISAFGEPATKAQNLAQHVVYGTSPKGIPGYDPVEGARRMKIMAGPGEKRVGSYGCTNMYGEDIDCLTGQLFPKGDTTIVINTKRPKDKSFIKNLMSSSQNIYPVKAVSSGYERGGTAIFPAMRTMFKQGGYYGMDGRFHKNTDSGTYVMDGGYYFQAGGGAPVASPSTPPTTGAPVDIPANQGWSPAGDGGFNIDTNFQYDVEDENQTDPALGGGMDSRQSRRRRSSDLYETPDLGGLSDEYQTDEQPMDEQPVYDASQYSSAVDPSTGFTTWSKNNKQLTNIKKQDPALWAQLKEEGRGARFRTGQTDIQKFGRAAGKIANTMQAGVELAGAIGNVLNERNRRRNMDAAAMNMGSTAAMFTNPQSAGKGDYGVTGSSYGAFKPYSTGTLSYKGMYGKYGMQVPKFQYGAGFSNLFGNVQSSSPISSPVELMSNIPIQAPVISPVDNLRVAYNQQQSSFEPTTVKYDFKKPLGKGLDVSGNPDLMKELFTYAQEKYGSPDKATITGINEMAWNKMGVYDKGKYNPKGKWKKHDDHIHFGFENPDVAIDIINKAQSLGLRASQNPYVDNVDPVHTKGSFHYSVFNKSDFITPKTSYEIPFMNYGKASTIPNPNEKDVATKLNNPGNILYNPAFEKFGATKSSILATDSGRPFAAFPSIEAGLKARESQLFGEVDGTFQSEYYKPNTDIDFALRRWSGGLNKDGTIQSGKGYGVEIYPELRGKKLKDITPAERRELMKRQIKRESGSMFKKLQKSGIFKMGGEQLGGQVVEMDEDQIQQFLAAGGQLEFID